MGKVYSHLSEEERQVIQIEVGNGTSVRKIARLLGRGPSGISREIRRNTWFPSNESESYRPYRPKRLKTGPWTGRYYIAGPAQHKADRRRAKPRKPYHLSCGRLWSRVAEWPGRGWSPPPVSGIIRRCLPKRTIIEPGMARELQEIVDETDNRPMRMLGHLTPAEAFADELLNLQDKQGCCTSK
ncbi:transposase [Bifidobacterium bifidum]|nr:transposase [Bifidobacterium bifidum]